MWGDRKKGWRENTEKEEEKDSGHNRERAEAKPSEEEEAKRSRRGEQKNLFPFSRVQEKSLSPRSERTAGAGSSPLLFVL